MAGEEEVANSTNAPTNTPLSSTSPLYMHPSENAGTTLVPTPFDGSGYRSWRRGVLRALSVKNKVGFINGKCKKQYASDVLFDQWERCDDMVTSWILNSLSKNLADSLQYVNDAKELWKELEDRYDQTNGAKLYQLQKEISDLNQGTFDITGYYTKMKKLWEELNMLNNHAQCSCQCEEKQREVKSQSQVMIDSTALNVNTTGVNTFRTNYSQNSAGTSGFRGNYNPNRPRPFCEYCKRPGHTKYKCYKLHGYPQGMNRPNNNSQTFNKYNKGKANVADAFLEGQVIE
ncbi:PREDICTED: uncharacterized protein LOC109218111 [Nicotiana attenuata]|uniref:uncharacterized protein LOC109218111 n=1 Tax=Nicotiana attenuata TaxID=49451 RepID=UPI0009048B70|nr:PREDICTED: uncharacterized protein LOC109218111 [Nicotiana attenuata]